MDAMIWNEKYELMDREDLAQVQIEGLQSTLNRVRRNVAFYRQAFERAGVKVEDVRGLADLAHLPFTTKADLRAAYPYDMFAVHQFVFFVPDHRIHPYRSSIRRYSLPRYARCTSRLADSSAAVPSSTTCPVSIT